MNTSQYEFPKDRIKPTLYFVYHLFSAPKKSSTCICDTDTKIHTATLITIYKNNKWKFDAFETSDMKWKHNFLFGKS